MIPDKILETLKGVRNALILALPYLPADNEAIHCGEWIDEINDLLLSENAK